MASNTQIQKIEVELNDWRFDVPQEGAQTIVLTTYKVMEYCVFTKGNHFVANRTSRGRILTKYECVAWIYRDDLQNAMIRAFA